MNKISLGDYVLVEEKGNEEKASTKTMVGKVMRLTSKGAEVRLEDKVNYSPITRAVDAEHLVMNFGAKPYPGKAYGFDFKERFRKTIETKAGNLDFFVSMKKENIKQFIEAFERVGRRLDKLGLITLLTDTNVTFEVRGKKGKYAGRFHPAKRKSGQPHRIHFYSEIPAESFDYVILHELGHLLQHDYLDHYPRVMSSWQVAFDRTVHPAEVTKDVVKGLRDAWIASQSGSEVVSLREFNKSLEEEERPALRAVVQWITQNRGVRAHELDILMLAENHEEVKELWPDRAIAAKKELKPLVSEYACKAMPELLAESFTFYVLKKKLPASITKLLEKSLTLAKKGPKANED